MKEFIEVSPFKVELHLSSFERIFEQTPFVLSCFNPSPSHDEFAQSYDKLKRLLSMIYLSFNLLLCYSCFCLVSSQAYDRLLRALTASDFT